MADEGGPKSAAVELFGSERMWGLKELPLPDSVPYWPQTPGWYVVGALVLAVFAYCVYRLWLRWKANQYRRDAVAELDAMTRDRTGLVELPFLLRRAALHAGPRADIAGLRGNEWIAWLNRSAGRDLFAAEDAGLLDTLCYAPAAADAIEPQQADRLIAASREWMKVHNAAV